MDADGYFYLINRMKDVIYLGGSRLFPRDIEEVIVQHPEVREAAVFGAPDDKWGETPVAAVVLRPESSVDETELASWINDRVGASYQRVRKILIVDEFPRNVAGKTLKRILRERFLS